MDNCVVVDDRIWLNDLELFGIKALHVSYFQFTKCQFLLTEVRLNRASAFYKEMCAYWLDRNINSISTDYIDAKDLSYRNVKVDNVTFDFACENRFLMMLLSVIMQNSTPKKPTRIFSVAML